MELYTTMHRVAAQEIHNMIKEYLQKKGIIPPDAPASTSGVIHQTHNDPPAPRQNQIVSGVEDLEWRITALEAEKYKWKKD